VPALVWIVGMTLVAVGTPLGIAFAYPGYAHATLPTLLLALFPLLGWQAIRRDHWRTLPVLIAAAALVTQVMFYRVGAPVVNDFSSLRDAAEIARDLPDATTVFAYKTRGHSFTYYGGRTVMRVRSPAAVAEVLGRKVPTAVLVKARHLEKIRQHLSEPVFIWWQSPSGRALLANVPNQNAASGARLAPNAASTPEADPPDDRPHC
jgi:hypothetical protein